MFYIILTIDHILLKKHQIFIELAIYIIIFKALKRVYPRWLHPYPFEKKLLI